MEYALLVEGPWGCGKSWFIKDYFERKQKTNPDNKLQPLFISLYGLKSTQEISDRIFYSAHPIFENKAARFLGVATSAITASLPIIGRSNLRLGVDSSELKKLAQELIIDLTDKILIFDDLERCSIPVTEVIGFINSFVEHQNLRVIIIANEKEIPSEQQGN